MSHNFQIIHAELRNFISSDEKTTCVFSHVPDRLKWDMSTYIHSFSDLEKLYRRCSEKMIDDPFGTVSLYDLSYNRSGLTNNMFSLESDVLIDHSSENAPNKTDKYLLILGIEFLPEEKDKSEADKLKTEKLLENPNGNGQICKMKLIHDPIPCNFYHAMIIFELNGDRITKENYKKKFKQSSKKPLKDLCRHELKAMIIKRKLIFGEN